MNDIVCFGSVDVNPSGVIIRNGDSNILVHFDECAKNYANEKSLMTSNCVATRDITKLTFTFYTNPRVNVVFKRHFFKDLFSGQSAVGKFLKLQKAISKYGYTSYDLS